MTSYKECISWLENIKKAIGRPQHSELWHYEQALTEIIEMIKNSTELPCKVGDTVYKTDGARIYELKIKSIVYDSSFIAFDDDAIGKTVFLTPGDAEKALKELNSPAVFHKDNVSFKEIEERENNE